MITGHKAVQRYGNGLDGDRLRGLKTVLTSFLAMFNPAAAQS